jgi:sugar phosphate isomerase/epimerase
MRTLLNTVALEPNRWTQDRIPAFDLTQDLLPAIRDAGFRHVEVWQYHVSRKTPDETKAARDAAARLGLDFPVVGAYPQFHLEGADEQASRAERFAVLDRAAILGARWVKFFFGRVKGGEITPRQLELTTARVAEWVACGRAKGLSFCAELHLGTLFDPCAYGRHYLAAHPDLDLRICYQPYAGQTTADCLSTIRGLGRDIVHAHFSGENASGRCRLADSALNWRAIAAALKEANPEFLPSIEFVPGGFQPKDRPFDLRLALADARADAEFLEPLLR